jgi:hypothetical protein
MNKAFMKEPETPVPTCPECGARGTRVERETLVAQIGEERARPFTSDAHFCWSPACPVGYFDAWSGRVPAEALTSPAYPTPPAARVGGCGGGAAAPIAGEARAGSRDAVLRILGHIRGGESACALRSPDGQSCERRVRRLFGENAQKQG